MSRLWQRTASIIGIVLVFSHGAVAMTTESALRALGWLNRGTGERIYHMVAPYVGRVPYAWGGDSLTRGMDCSAFSRFVMGKLGVRLPRTVGEQSRIGRRIPSGTARPGDLVFFDASSRRPGLDHVGIYLGRGLFVHSVSPVGVTVTRLANYEFPVVQVKRVLG